MAAALPARHSLAAGRGLLPQADGVENSATIVCPFHRIARNPAADSVHPSLDHHREGGRRQFPQCPPTLCEVVDKTLAPTFCRMPSASVTTDRCGFTHGWKAELTPYAIEFLRRMRINTDSGISSPASPSECHHAHLVARHVMHVDNPANGTAVEGGNARNCRSVSTDASVIGRTMHARIRSACDAISRA